MSVEQKSLETALFEALTRNFGYDELLSSHGAQLSDNRKLYLQYTENKDTQEQDIGTLVAKYCRMWVNQFPRSEEGLRYRTATNSSVSSISVTKVWIMAYDIFAVQETKNRNIIVEFSVSFC